MSGISVQQTDAKAAGNAIFGIREQIAFLFPGEPVHPRFVAVDELVEKPVEPEFLLERVSALLETAEARKTEAN